MSEFSDHRQPSACPHLNSAPRFGCAAADDADCAAFFDGSSVEDDDDTTDDCSFEDDCECCAAAHHASSENVRCERRDRPNVSVTISKPIRPPTPLIVNSSVSSANRRSSVALLPPVGDETDELCSRISALRLQQTPNPVAELPLHDRRILQRMLAKRTDAQQRSELAHTAHERWQREQLARHHRDQQRAAQLHARTQHSTLAARERFAQRRAALWQRDRWRTSGLRTELQLRDQRLAERLDGSRSVQRSQLAAKHAGDTQRLAEASWRRERGDWEQRLRQLDCHGSRTQRLDGAQATRAERAAARRRRVAAENDAEWVRHARRLEALRGEERAEVERVRGEIEERRARGADFVRHRSDRMEERRRRAAWTAELREAVRGVAMPGTIAVGGGGMLSWRSGGLGMGWVANN